MATRARGIPGNGRRGGGRERKASSSNLFWMEVGGAVLVGVVLIALFSGGKADPPPRKDPAPEPARETQKPAPAPAPKPAAPPASFSSERSRKRPSVPPLRPAPAADLTQGRQLFEKAQGLWNEALKLREQGKTDQSREKLHEAYALLEKALASVEEFNLWDEEADLKNWIMDSQVLATKRQIGAWFELRSRVHKILPNRGK